MPVWVVLSAVSLFVRFRRARGMEREQIKWLFYAGVVFALSYVPSFILSDFSEDYNIWNLLWGVGMLTFPAAIGIAILRYRLWDIDILIRRTLQYSILTGVLGLVYFGGVTVLQSLFSTISGQESPAALVISTLGIAALFNPLRRRTQDFIDRRFYRRKYNAEKVLADFAAITRQGADLEQLAGHLNVTLQETLQPDQIGLWLKSAHRTQQITQEQEK
jgi:peptidoglycan/LPS O-acetylase OafA/YrhL